MILKSLETFGLKKMSQLEAIMAEFSKVGPNKKGVEMKTNQTEEEELQAAEDAKNSEVAIDVDSGDIPVKEYDYLLSMPMWSVTEEKIEQLTAQMNEKKNEHDTL